MRNGIVLAGGVVAGGVLTLALSATGARAGEWCGYASHKDAVVECGYMSSAECETAVGKGGMCFVDPDVALDAKRAAPVKWIAQRG